MIHTLIVLTLFTHALGETKCANANEGGTLSLHCPSGQKISSVDFASYGTPVGGCGSYQTHNCHASNSKSKLEQACKGKTSCSISATNGVFGDPCFGTYKRISAQVTCSKFVLHHTNSKSFNGARSDCVIQGGELATPRDENENNEIRKVAGNRKVWIGVNDIAHEGQWKDAQGNAIRWTKWHPGEPNNSGNEDCTELYTNGGWNDLPCSHNRPYVCRIVAVPPPGGLVLYTSAKNFNDAEIYCVSKRGVLATPHNENENAQIRNIAGGQKVWIGVNDIATEGQWKDARGNAILWTKWHPGEPNNSGNEDCTEMYTNGAWNDLPCSHNRAFVCRSYTEIGPYRDTGDRALKYGPHQYGYTAETCHAACWKYKYFALQHDGWCCCDNDLAQATKYGKSNCGKRGGGWCNYIYQNENLYTEIGPYADTSDRALKHGPHQYGYTAEKCLAACPEYKYFALQNNGWCCCGNDLKRATKYGKSKCGKTGGGWCNYIYQNSRPVGGVPVEDATFQKFYVGFGVFLIVGGSAIYLKNRYEKSKIGDYEQIRNIV